MDYYGICYTKNSFDFSSFIKVYCLIDKFMCALDIRSLFSYVPFLETIDSCIVYIFLRTP